MHPNFKSLIIAGLILLSFNGICGVLQSAGSIALQTSMPSDALFSTPNVETITNFSKPVTSNIEDSAVNTLDLKYKASLNRLSTQAASLEKYLLANNFNTEYVFMMDMSLPSGKNRFFVYNIKKGATEQSALVTHGVGSNKYNNDDPLEFSNVPDSRKTSIGRYKIGSSYYGKFGLAYKMYGLDSTNSKAFERAIVLHSHKEVPDKEPYPGYIIVSAGCPVVSPAFMNVLNKYISSSKKPILLWIYN